MKDTHEKRLYFPALSILAIVLMLLIFISISTYRNLHRQKTTMLQLAYRQGIFLLHALEAGARSGIAMQRWHADALGNLITEVGTNQDIAYIYLLDTNGIVIHSASSQPVERPGHDRIHLAPNAQIRSQLVKLKNGQEVYELVKQFDPLLVEGTFGASDIPDPNPSERAIDHSHSVIVLGLKMVAFANARRADLNHAVIMGVIVLALGAGVMFFFYVIQRYFRVNRELQIAQNYTRQVVASLATGLVSIDSQRMVKSYNRPALEMLGISAETLLDKPLNHLLDFDSSGISLTLNEKRSVLEREIHHRLHDNSELPLAISVSPIKETGDNSYGAVILLRDLSEIKALEAQMRRAEKLAAVGEMAASIAHEIRNPLSSLKGFAQFLHKGIDEGAPEREYTQIMIQEVNRINAVVTDLLAFARPMEAKSRSIDITQLVEHIIRLVQPDAQERDIVVQKYFKTENITCSVDEGQMTQALLNLLLNAMSAIGQNGTVTLGVEIDTRLNELCLWVDDDGPGISPDLHEKVFEPFFTLREKGTGLGLAIVQKIVEHHNGRVELTSPAPLCEKGSRFAIHLPLPEVDRQ